MRFHEVECRKVAYSFVKLSRTAEIGEEEGQTGDLQPLIHFYRVGAVDVAEGLVGEQALGSQERAAAAEQTMQGLVRYANRWQGADLGVVLHRNAHRTGPQLKGLAMPGVRDRIQARGSAAPWLARL